jgi:hypothetical protein
VKREKSYQGEGAVKSAFPIPRILDLSQHPDRRSASLLLDTPGACATCETLADSLVVVWLHPDGAKEFLTSS